jgi:hypothetical protein
LCINIPPAFDNPSSVLGHPRPRRLWRIADQNDYTHDSRDVKLLAPFFTRILCVYILQDIIRVLCALRKPRKPLQTVTRGHSCAARADTSALRETGHFYFALTAPSRACLCAAADVRLSVLPPRPQEITLCVDVFIP